MPKPALLSRVQYSPSLPRDFVPSSIHRPPATSQDAFFLRVTSNTMPGKSAIRSWAKRRMRDAVIREFKQRGWGRDGRWKGVKVETPGENQLGEQGVNGVGRITAAKSDLRGLLRVFTLSPILRATGTEVQREARSAVENVMRKMGNENRGKKLR